MQGLAEGGIQGTKSSSHLYVSRLPCLPSMPSKAVETHNDQQGEPMSLCSVYAVASLSVSLCTAH